MKPDRWRQIDNLLEEALNREPDQRAAFLDETCAGDDELRKEVEALLSAHEKAGSFCEKPALDAATRAMVEKPSGSLVGRRLGPYEVLSLLGAGGMGEVYRAKDTILGRQVAIKVLPDLFTLDPERLARFEREAKLLASLNHPNIASIYGLDQTDGKRFLVLELVEGQTLAERLHKRPLPVEEALEVCRQIAEGLEAAHEKGVIHRDLKPANVKVTPEGKVKILDFGLAKAFYEQAAPVDPSRSPAITDQMTAPGVILGTAAYMSPEQAKGKTVDKRTDIWAFGCVLYECLTAKRAFQGETITETVAAILKSEPDWEYLRSSTPWKVTDLLHRCFKKDVRERLRDIGDARIEIAEAHAQTMVQTGLKPSPRGIKWSLVVLLLLAALLVGACAALFIVWKTGPSILGEMTAQPSDMRRPPIIRRFSILLPEQDPLAPVGMAPLGVGRPAMALSPDGSQLVYVGQQDGQTQLYRRSLDSMKAQPLPHTSGAYHPVYSPDGQWVSFFAGNQLKKIPATGGQPITLCEATNTYGATWADDGKIYFAPHEGDVLCSVSAEGGPAEIVAVPDRSKVMHQFWWPYALPAGKGILFANGLLSLPGKQLRQLFKDRDQPFAVDPRYLPSGHIVYSTNGSLMAFPFDIDRLEPTGMPRPVLEGIRTEAFSGAQYATSSDGTLIFVPGQSASVSRPALVDRRGDLELLPFPPDRYGSFRISPDGTKLAISIEGISSHLYIFDLTGRRTSTRLSTEENEGYPIWTPDGSRITFSGFVDGSWSVFWRPSDRSSERERLMKSNEVLIAPESWSHSGLLSLQQIRATGSDLLVFDLRTWELHPFRTTRFKVCLSAFSPDGGWIAYTSDESGDYEVYLQQYPEGRKVQVSAGGGNEAPVWSRDGHELFYRNGRRWISVSEPTNPRFSAGDYRVVFQGDYLNVPGLDYDVMPDGKHFLVLQPTETSRPTELHVILNWFEELKRLCPTRK